MHLSPSPLGNAQYIYSNPLEIAFWFSKLNRTVWGSSFCEISVSFEVENWLIYRVNVHLRKRCRNRWIYKNKIRQAGEFLQLLLHSAMLESVTRLIRWNASVREYSIKRRMITMRTILTGRKYRQILSLYFSPWINYLW